MDEQSEQQLNRTFAALSDPTRRQILARLAAGEASVGELAAPFDMSFAAVSKHLRVLEAAGLVTRGREAQYRPARLEARPLAAASRWINDYARFWSDSLDSLDAYLGILQQFTTSTEDTHTAHDKENPHG
jgi:DNA-binding transcriptional ArsR family regulator